MFFQWFNLDFSNALFPLTGMHFRRIIVNGLMALCFATAIAQEGPTSTWLLSRLSDQLLAKGYSTESVQSLRVKDFYQSSQSGLYHLFAQQAWQGIGLEGMQVSAVMDQRGKVRYLTEKGLLTSAPSATSLPPAASAAQAIQSLLTHLGTNGQPVLHLPATGSDLQSAWMLDAHSHRAIQTKLVWLSTKSKGVRLTWFIDFAPSHGDHWWYAWVDVQNNEVLLTRDLVLSCQFAHPESGCTPGAHAHHDLGETFSPQKTHANGTYRVYDMPIESPSFGNRTLVTDPHDLVASPFGWHDTDGIAGAEYTITRGNNVYASEDQDDDDLPGLAPNGGASLTFDYPINFSLAPSTYLDAVTTNLFYWNNLMHDVWYHYGFDEQSGNFQENNYGRGGTAGDYVNADAQDGSGTNNANFATPGDGSNPRMQMFLWNPPGTVVEGLTINSPAALAGGYNTSFAGFGPSLSNISVTGDLALVAGNVGTSTQGCGTLTNAATVAGKIAVVDRGGCTFVEKTLNAQNAGAIGVIVVNNTGGNPTPLGGNDPTITIPAVMVSQANGTSIKNALSSFVVNGTLSNPGSANSKDSGLDNVVIAHEYGHGISTRLTGGPGTSCLFNEEQAGEGWSDWFGLVMTVKPGDNGVDPRGVATYLQGQATTGSGIRPERYSTDMATNPLTYDDVKTLSVPHGVGTVWASMIWDLYWNLVDEYGWNSDIYTGNGGNNIAMSLVMEGLKLQGCFPGFVDSRNAILAADSILYGGVNTCLIWSTFARRGLGYSADQGNPDDRSDGVEAFDMPPVCQPILFVEKYANQERVAAGTDVSFSFFVRNQKDQPLTQVTVRDTLSTGLTLVPGSSTCPVVDNNGILEFNLGTLAAGASRSCAFRTTVSPFFPSSEFIWDDNLESGAETRYIVQSVQGTSIWKLDTGNARSADISWFVPNTNGFNEQDLIFNLTTPVTNQSVLRFWHLYNTELSFDGGVVEFLETTTGQWRDLGPFMISNGYNAQLDANNTLGSRQGFSGRSNGWILTRVDLSSFAGQVGLIRFRFGSDEFLGVEGWYLDDISISSEKIVSNRLTVTSAEGDAVSDEIDGTILVTAGVTSVEEELAHTFYSLYPNPAQGAVTLSWNEVSALPTTVRLSNLLGQNLKTWSPSSGTAIRMDVSDLPGGLYLMEARSEKGTAVWKLRIDRP